MAKGHDIRNLLSAEDENCLSPGEMRAYLEGKGNPTERHRVERHLLNCDLCSLAYEGWTPSDEAATIQGAEVISENAWNRIAEKKKRRGAFVWISVAASAMILITAAWWLFRQPSEERMDEVFTELMDQSLKNDTNLNPKGGLDSYAQADPEKTAEEAVAEKSSPVAVDEVKDMEGWFAESERDEGPRDVEPVLASPNAISAPPRADNVKEDADDYNMESVAIQDESLLDEDAKDRIETKSVAAGKSVRSEKNVDAMVAQNSVKSKREEPQKKERQNTKPDALSGSGSVDMKSKSPGTAPKTKESAVPKEEATADYAPISLNDSVSGGVTATGSTYQSGMDAYRNRQFQEAALLLRKASAETPQNLDAHLHAGISFLNISQPQAAIYHFERVLAEPQSNLREDAEWYKALAYLRMNEARKAKSLMESISKQNGKHAEPARKALDDLK